MDLAGQYGSIKHESTANGMNTVIVVILALVMISFIVLTVIFVAKVQIYSIFFLVSSIFSVL